MAKFLKISAVPKGREANQWNHLPAGILLRMTGKTALLRILSFTFSAAGAATLWPV